MMVITDPSNNERRRAREATIRIIDMVTYLAVLAGGIFALFFTPDSVKLELVGLEAIIILWASLLMIGGIFGFVGRLTRVWAVELPGTIAGIFGALIYAVVLGKSASTSPTALVAVTLVIIATLTLLRRYIELQIFTSEPGATTFVDRVRQVLRRRTPDAVPRHN